ncbi:MAG: hypothetical protein QG629_843 [Patescibacteria group bacterium]|nr:class I SAM-dependent methyltransferase [Candidatus Saccharibacteria bacterium]MDQ5963760.1 hypothetical protein [Patescibacteria group bacterium]
MSITLLILMIVVSLFAVVLLVGAPYLPTLSTQIETAFDLLDLEKDQTVLELGCGDGKVLLAAVKRGYQAVGVELNPILFVIAWLRTVRYRGRVRVIWGDFWRMEWPPSDGVFVFLLDRFMPRLDTQMRQYKRPLVSIAFQISGKKPAREKQGVFLYRY